MSFTSPTRVHLGAGSVLSFVVNNNGTHSYDSTGLRLSVAAVPEPASWTMMLAGFGALGVTMRRKRAVASLRAA